MGGTGSSNIFRNESPEDLGKRVRDTEETAISDEFKSKLASLLGDLLTTYNNRDTDLVRERLDTIKKIIGNEIEGSIDQIFGGSVAKHTYVDGISDIDSLIMLSGSIHEADNPSTILDKMTDLLRSRIGESENIYHGKMAVTVEFLDGMKIQLLPAVKTDGGLRVPSAFGDNWSKIDPQSFQRVLTDRNEKCGGKLIPTIKLAKAVIGTLPESQRLSGYHLESLAINAFRNYEGAKTTSDMLPVFFEKAKDMVLSPMRDRTGQSVHVDEYLGGDHSEVRVNASHILTRIAKRMRNASAALSTSQWQALFEA